MKKITLRTLRFITAVFAAITSITFFIINKIAFGVIWACIAVTFCLFGLSNKSKDK